ncbi:MAG: hypothetical protein H0U44_00030 [Flavisolibacter sp.]|jgi:hypothetical protein|nr:hypothetical protein [Flavisolibacter sp.]
MKPICLLLLLFFCGPTSAQKISGFYTGTLYNDSSKLVQQYELALSEYRGKITGYSYVTFVSNDTFYYGIRKVKAQIDGDNLVVEDDKFLAHNFPESPAKGVKRLFVIPINRQDSLIDLNGTWQTNRTKQYYSIPGKVELSRSTDSAKSALFTHLREMDEMRTPAQATNQKPKTNSTKPPAASKELKPAEIIPVDKRIKKELAIFEVTGDSLQLSFYDNGVIDGDSVSVYINGEKIIDAARLTAIAIRKNIVVQQDAFEIVLVAENLGSIPPNTGLLMIRDGDKIYQLHFAADLKTNASIRIIRKRK